MITTKIQSILVTKRNGESIRVTYRSLGGGPRELAQAPGSRRLGAQVQGRKRAEGAAATISYDAGGETLAAIVRVL